MDYDVNRDDDVSPQEQRFHDAVRECVISTLLFVCLYVIGYQVIRIFKKRPDKEDLYGGDSEDALVYRISVWCCTFTLATSLGAVLLLPCSLISNEVLIRYPNSYYVQWLSSSLVHRSWNTVFLFSNLSLFVLLPFTYFFMESAGFSGSKKGIWARMQETVVMLLLLGILVLGLAWMFSAILGNDRRSQQTFLEAWNFYLPFLYSCISFFGVVLLLLFTPVGFARLFTEVGKYVMRPQLLKNVDEALYTVRFEEESLARKLREHLPNANGELVNGAVDIHRKLEEMQRNRMSLEKKKYASSLRRNLVYPSVMLVLLVLTCGTVIMVGLNILELLFDRKALPAESTGALLGTISLSMFGFYGSLIEIAIIFYILVASLAGLYSLPMFCWLRPQVLDTAMTKVICNCAILLILSSALPVQCRILGVSDFDLLGNFGRQEWLASFYLVLLYNVVFCVAATLCLVKKFTVPVQKEIYNKLTAPFSKDRAHSISDLKYFD